MQAGNIPESVRMAGQRAPWVGIEGPGAFLACASSLRRRQFCTPIALTLSIEDVACVQDDLVRVAHKIHALKLTRPAPASWGDDAVQRMLCNLVSSCTNLQHFDISNTQGEVKDVVVQQLASSCRDLVGLDASYCDGEITDVSMVQVARRCRQLEYLSVGANNRMITDGSILVLARHARHLRHLNVSATGGAITSTSIEQILCRCNHLCTLDISHTNIAAGIVLWMLNALQAPSLTLHFLVDAKPARAEWRYPSVIIVTGCEATGWGDDNFALATVIGKDARSDGMRVVTALQALAFNAVSALLVGVAHKIHALKLTRPAPASWGDDAVQRMLCNVVSRCTNLRHFDISNTQGEVKDVVVQQLASSCRDLVGLDASYCDGEITNQSIMHVARRCRQLEYLSVGANNRKITDDSILVLARHARHLRHLNVSATGGAITSTSIEQILRRCARIELVDTSHTSLVVRTV